MSLLIPDHRDRWDAYSQREQDEIYFDEINQLAPDFLFSSVSGWFKQALDETDDMTFNYTLEDFGLNGLSWKQVVAKLTQLNTEAEPSVSYKLLLLARHGEGFHNVANKKYFGDEWRNKYRFLGTDGEITWGPDADLTDLGIAQAKENNSFLKSQLEKGMPIPQKFYVSPLRRSCKTLVEEWTDIDIPTPIVSDLLRETIGIHLCHKRATKTQIKENFPTFDFEEDFSETDVLHEVDFAQVRENFWQQFIRVHQFLAKLFQNNADPIISITSHAGTMRAFITVTGHRKFTIPTGGMIPIIVKATRNLSG